MSEAFWLNDPANLFTGSNWTHFVPTPEMTVPAALNAVFRFTIYFSVLLFGATGVSAYLAAIPLMAVLTIVLYRVFPETQKMKETFVSSYTGSDRTLPVVDNPFMNAALTEILDNPNRPPAADVTEPEVREAATRAFAQTSNLYMDTTDMFDLVQAQRNFHTVPEDDHAGLKAFIAKGGTANDKTLSESYVPAKGTVSEVGGPGLAKPSISEPPGTAPSFAAGLDKTTGLTNPGTLLGSAACYA